MPEGPAAISTIGPSPLMGLPGAIATPHEAGSSAAGDLDAEVAWHYGDPLGEQRAALRGAVLLDRWNTETVTVDGPDRLTWLHSLCSQKLDEWGDGDAAEALWLSPQGRIEHWADATNLGESVRLATEPGRAADLANFLTSMTFWSKVDVRNETSTWAGLTVQGPQARDAVLKALGVTVPPPGHAAILNSGVLESTEGSSSPDCSGYLRTHADRIDVTVRREQFAATAQRLRAAGARPAGSWAAAALRIPERRPRFGVDNDERTIPHETSWLATAVHLNKGCYRGQETVARVDNLGAPPRRLVLLYLDGSADHLPCTGDAVTTADGRTVGRIGTVTQHWEDGPVALALVKRTIGADTPLLADGVDASIDPADKPIATRAVTIDRAAFPRFAQR